MATSIEEPLLIPAEIYDAMVAHCQAQDRACCGILAGMPPRVSAIYPLGNIAVSPDRYEADPSDLIGAHIDFHARGLSITAIYHFCPGSEPVPSPTDLLENHYGELPRIIFSRGKVMTVRVWRLTAENYEELDWRLLPREECSEPLGAGCHPDWQELEGSGRVRERGSLLGSIFSRAVRWLRPTVRAPSVRVGGASPSRPDPMWDPSVDSSQEQGAPG